MKKILVICTNKIVAQQMKVYSLNRHLSTKYYFLVEKNNQINKVNKILKKFRNRKVYRFNTIGRPFYFSLIHFYNFFKIKKNNKKIKNNLNKIKKIKKIFDQKYSEVWFSNDNLSKLILYKRNIAKIYFSHGANDFLIDYRYLNLFNNLKRKIEDYVNNNYMNVFKPSTYNVKIFSIFNNFVKNNYNFNINKKNFRKFFYKDLNSKKNKKLDKKNINLINFSIPYSYFEKKYSIQVLNDYLQFFQEIILKKIFSDYKHFYLIKFKDHIPNKIKEKIIKKIKKNFPKYKIFLFKKTNAKTNSLEKFVVLNNVRNYYSNFTSSFFLIKILKPKVILYNFSDHILRFWKKNEHKMMKNHKQNKNNLLRVQYFYQKIWKEI